MAKIKAEFHFADSFIGETEQAVTGCGKTVPWREATLVPENVTCPACLSKMKEDDHGDK